MRGKKKTRNIHWVCNKSRSNSGQGIHLMLLKKLILPPQSLLRSMCLYLYKASTTALVYSCPSFLEKRKYEILAPLNAVVLPFASNGPEFHPQALLSSHSVSQYSADREEAFLYIMLKNCKIVKIATCAVYLSEGHKSKEMKNEAI